MSNTSLLTLALVTFFTASGCGAKAGGNSAVKAASDTLTIDVTADLRPNIEALLATLAAAADGTGDLHVADLASIVKFAAIDADVFSSAYPTALKVSCDAGPCASSGTGTAAKAPIIAESPDLAGVSMGVKKALSAEFKTLTPGQSALVCNVDGVYFSKLIARKNLKAFRIDLTPTAGTVKVWLAGASDIPSCD